MQHCRCGVQDPACHLTFSVFNKTVEKQLVRSITWGNSFPLVKMHFSLSPYIQYFFTNPITPFTNTLLFRNDDAWWARCFSLGTVKWQVFVILHKVHGFMQSNEFLNATQFVSGRCLIRSLWWQTFCSWCKVHQLYISSLKQSYYFCSSKIKKNVEKMYSAFALQ